MFVHLLDEAQANISPDIALRILQESQSTANAVKLFQVASRLRDERIGTHLWWSGAIEGILPCRLAPMCSHCSYSDFTPMTAQDLVTAVKALEALGFRHLHISGGAKLAGYDAEIVGMVEAMRAASDIAIEVNVGPSLQRDTVRKLKELKVSSITSSLETTNPEVFRATKPGDSLERRKTLLEICEQEGMPTRTMVLIGLGETYQDRIEHLFYLRGLKGMRHVRFSRFFPPPTGRLNLARCSPWELARVIAVARLIMPDIQLGLASGNSHDDIPLWLLAGGGNQLLGAAAVRKKAPAQFGAETTLIADDLSVVDRRTIQQQYAASMGLKIGFECPPNA